MMCFLPQGFCTLRPCHWDRLMSLKIKKSGNNDLEAHWWVSQNKCTTRTVQKNTTAIHYQTKQYFLIRHMHSNYRARYDSLQFLSRKHTRAQGFQKWTSNSLFFIHASQSDWNCMLIRQIYRSRETPFDMNDPKSYRHPSSVRTLEFISHATDVRAHNSWPYRIVFIHIETAVKIRNSTLITQPYVGSKR